jgi:type I restriction enzyme S subunit
MQHIQSIKLKDITSKIGSGATPRGGKNSYKTEGMALIRSLNVYDFSFAYEGLAFIDEKQANQLENVSVERDDILLNITGASVCRCCLVPPNVLPARVNQHVSIVRIKPRAADARYVLYAINSPYNKRRLLAIAQGGATREALTKEKIENFEIPVPPLPTQQKISAILSAYDDLIENNLRRIKILEEMAQSLYREWFVKFRFRGHQKVKMVNSPLGKIPDGWEIRQIGEVIETLGGGTPSTKEPSYWEGGDIDWYSPSDLTASGSMFITGSSKKITQIGLDKSSAKLFPAYSLMMTSRATIGVVSINTQKACTNQGFITCVPSDRLSVFHLYFWIEESREKIISVASGATFKEISRGEFREFPIVVPPPFVENTFTETVEPMCRLIENLIKKNQNLVVTRDLLLPKLISGELDVLELDITISEANA